MSQSSTPPSRSEELARGLVRNYIEVHMKSTVEDEPDLWYEMPMFIAELINTARKEAREEAIEEAMELVDRWDDAHLSRAIRALKDGGK